MFYEQLKTRDAKTFLLSIDKLFFPLRRTAIHSRIDNKYNAHNYRELNAIPRLNYLIKTQLDKAPKSYEHI